MAWDQVGVLGVFGGVCLLGALGMACDDSGASAEDAAVDGAAMVVVDARPDVEPVDAQAPGSCGAQIIYRYDDPVSFRRLPRQDTTPGEFNASCASGRGPERIVELVLGEDSRVEVYFESEVPLTMFVRRDCLDEDSELWCETGLEAGPTFEVLAAGRWYLFFEPAEAGVDLPVIYVRTISEPI
jgi:hypothetical protein